MSKSALKIGEPRLAALADKVRLNANVPVPKAFDDMVTALLRIRLKRSSTRFSTMMSSTTLKRVRPQINSYYAPMDVVASLIFVVLVRRVAGIPGIPASETLCIQKKIKTKKQNV